MQWLTLLSEDYGVQSLRADNRKPAIARAVERVSPYPSAHPARIGEHPETPHQHVENRHQGDRRKSGDRRRKQVPVILDTRSNRSRRALYSQNGDKAAGTPSQRINVYA
ncbi:MAG: hypothetical protein BMS9Abin09_1016 [Gammaproteobacteria bacterium]|nr:MAG: hypothetical protein BMS9Abin09_1016 [Gammaproteobacteria bacterium]